MSKFQAFNDPRQPLSGEKPHDRETVLAELAATVLRLIPSTT
ncbi:hypothetical protein [Plantactinospora sp. BB1]|nr:hypothetical protein [Plantactinospora sp. BB1]